MLELDDLSLAELFTLSDEIGDKYLTDEEITERDRELAEAFELIDDTELTEAQENESYRRTALIYFNQYVDGEMIRLDGDEDDLPSDREMTKRLKAYAATLTPNRLTSFDSDGYTLMFKEVVEVEFDYYPHFPMWAQSDLDGVKPHYLPNGCNDNGADVSSYKLKK